MPSEPHAARGHISHWAFHLGACGPEQRRLLRELDLTDLEALRDYKLAPLSSRRDMAMLGALHKLCLGTAPPQLALLLPARGVVHEPAQRQRLRFWRPLHDKQLSTPCGFRSSDLMKRSLFGLALSYNTLPQAAVDCRTVKLFQKKLQLSLLCYAEHRAAQGKSWERLYSVHWRELPRTKLDELFLDN